MTTAPLLFLLGIAAFNAAPASNGGADPARKGMSPRSDLSRAYDLDHPWEFHPRFKDKAEWERRAKALREQVLVSQGLWPLPEKTPLHPVIHGKIDRGEYTVEKVYFQSLPGLYVTGNLYRPKETHGRKVPGVLCPHGHWENGRFYENSEAGAGREIEIGAEGTMESARYPLQARCAMLARMGCVVFHYDMIGNADSRQIAHREGFTDADAILRLQSFMGLQTWNSVRSLDFLLSLPEVDPERIGVTGASGGGTQTMLLDAVDGRPALAFPAVMVSEAMQGGCVCENSPLLRVGTNNVEFAALFAPRPQGMTGANDWTREIETKGLPELKGVYGLYGAADAVTAKYFPFDHNYNQVSREMMYNWVNRHFRLGWEEPVKEKPFEPIPPKDLSVWDDAHPYPSDAPEAKRLRAALREMNDRQMAELHRRPEEYRRVVRRALEVMVHDAMPGKGSVSFQAGAKEEREGFTLERGSLAGADRRAVPAVRLIPSDWDGSLLLWLHPDGSRSLFDGEGGPSPRVRQCLDRKTALLAPNLFLTSGEVSPADWEVEKRLHDPGLGYGGFVFGYNRSLPAERVSDILTALAGVPSMDKVKSLKIAGLGKAGPWTLLACALADTRHDRIALDLNGFDFDRVKEVTDEMMLPGALKYGGLPGFVPLLSGDVSLYHLSDSPAWDGVKTPKGVTLHREPWNEKQILQALLANG
jgi:hypothetical protein